jgi:hypothetical protein
MKRAKLTCNDKTSEAYQQEPQKRFRRKSTASDQVARQRDEQRAYGRYTLGEAAKAIASSDERFEMLEAKLCEAAEGGDLPVYGPGERASSRPTSLIQTWSKSDALERV